MTGRVAGTAVVCGNERLMTRRGVTVPAPARERVRALEDLGRTVVYVAENGRLVGLVGVADTLRPEVPEALGRLRALGIRRMLLLTGRQRAGGARAGGRARGGVSTRSACPRRRSRW